MHQDFTYTIKCSICQTPIGQLILNTKFHNPNDVNDDYIDAADHRCDSCETLHGNFKEMLEDCELLFGRGTKDQPSQAEAFVKLHRKQDKITQELIKNPKVKDLNPNDFTNPIIKQGISDEVDKNNTKKGDKMIP